MTALQMLVKIGADISGFEKEIGKVEKGTKAMADRMTGMGSKLSMGVTAPLLAIGGAAAKMAMDAVESENLFEVSFGNLAGSVRGWSQQLRDQLGLNEYELRKNAGTFFVMFDSMGIGKQAAVGMSEGLTKLAYDESQDRFTPSP